MDYCALVTRVEECSLLVLSMGRQVCPPQGCHGQAGRQPSSQPSPGPGCIRHQSQHGAFFDSSKIIFSKTN